MTKTKQIAVSTALFTNYVISISTIYNCRLRIISYFFLNYSVNYLLLSQSGRSNSKIRFSYSCSKYGGLYLLTCGVGGDVQLHPCTAHHHDHSSSLVTPTGLTVFRRSRDVPALMQGRDGRTAKYGQDIASQLRKQNHSLCYVPSWE